MFNLSTVYLIIIIQLDYNIISNYKYFVSGMHFCQAVAIIQSQVGIIKGVQVLYSDKVHHFFIY